MFNNVALDVAIGLVFIFLLYSLLATTINEFIAMIFAYRHRMLEKAIEQMLDGKNYSYYWWDKVANILRWWFNFKTYRENFEKNDLSEKVLPRKVFLRNIKINDTNNFVKGDNDYIKRGKLNKKAALFANKIINHPLYRRKSEDSLLYKKPAYLSASAFSDILFDILGNRKSENNSLPVLMNDIKSFVSELPENNKELKSILNIYMEQANGDVQKFKLLLEDWFDDTMNRVSGWYKRQATKVLFGIGIALAFAFNVSTIEIVHKLSVNKELRDAMSKSASAYVENANKKANTTKAPPNNSQEGKHTSITTDTASNDNDSEKNKSSIQQDLNSSKTDSSQADNPDAEFNNAKKQINNIRQLYNDTISEVNMMMGLGWDSSILYKNFIEVKKIKDGKKLSLWLVNSDSINWFNKSLQWLLPTWVFNGYYSSLSVIATAFSHPILIIGFLITGLAITLGAPFWFDLLNKFVNVRAGGNKPSEDSGSSGTTTISKTITLNQKPDLNSFG